MSPKILVAFLAGLVVASGITFFVMRKPQPSAQPMAVQRSAVQTPAAQPVPAAAVPAPVQVPSDVMAENVPPAEKEAAPARTRRAKATARVTRHEYHAPQLIAKVQTPAPVPASPAPVQQQASAAPVEQQPAAQPEPVAETRNIVPPAPAPPPPEPNTVTIPAGTTLQVRMGETLSTERNRDGDSFVATLDQPLVVDGFVIAERGARVRGRVVQSLRSGRVEGSAKLGLELTEVSTSDGQRVKINTAAYEKESAQTRKTDAAKIGGGAALGAIIGAIAGGGKGAAIGAGVGGAAGTGGVIMTRGKAAEIPVETRLSFRLKNPVTVTEQLH